MSAALELSARRGALIRDLITPEGVPLHLEVARAGDRIAAFLLDLLFIGLATLVLIISALFGAGAASVVGLGWLAFIVLIVAWFLLWHFYFIYFELRWQGRTPGKRLVGIRVVDRGGGPLTVEAVCARNFVRDFELKLPLLLLIVPGELVPAAPGWVQYLGFVWMLILILLPAFHPQRLRLGDIVGGTLVVLGPKAGLLRDLTARTSKEAAREAAPRFHFAAEQLDLYGEYELTVLERLLRASTLPQGTVEKVSGSIRRKIGWTEPVAPAELRLFLREFYRAQRAHLEHKLLLGQRKTHKKDGVLGDRSA